MRKSNSTTDHCSQKHLETALAMAAGRELCESPWKTNAKNKKRMRPNRPRVRWQTSPRHVEFHDQSVRRTTERKTKTNKKKKRERNVPSEEQEDHETTRSGLAQMLIQLGRRRRWRRRIMTSREEAEKTQSAKGEKRKLTKQRSWMNIARTEKNPKQSKNKRNT